MTHWVNAPGGAAVLAVLALLGCNGAGPMADDLHDWNPAAAAAGSTTAATTSWVPQVPYSPANAGSVPGNSTPGAGGTAAGGAGGLITFGGVGPRTTTVTTPTAGPTTTTGNPGAGTTPGTATTPTTPTQTATTTPTQPAAPAVYGGTTTQGPGRATADSSMPNDPHMQYALGVLNETRKLYGAPPIQLDTAQGKCALGYAQDIWACAGGTLLGYASGNCGDAPHNAGVTCGTRKHLAGVGAEATNDKSFLVWRDYYVNQGPGNKGFNVITNPAFTTVAIGMFADTKGTIWIATLWK